jgi:hypothetical protein
MGLGRLVVEGACRRHSRAQCDDVVGRAPLDPELRDLATQRLPREGCVHVDRRARLLRVVRAELEEVLPGAVLAAEGDHRAAHVVPAAWRKARRSRSSRKRLKQYDLFRIPSGVQSLLRRRAASGGIGTIRSSGVGCRPIIAAQPESFHSARIAASAG